MECAVITAVGRRLALRLRREDPLAGRVKLGKLDGLFGIAAALAVIA
jgi:hypothetical protein